MIKQVILVRTDLNMRKGKIAAQVAHASLKVFFDRKVAGFNSTINERISPKADDILVIPLTAVMAEWVNGAFTKIVLGVETEADLLRAYEAAKAAGIPTALITDLGHTEFHGVPTNTTVALGPAKPEDIDLITGPTGLVKTKLL